MLEPRDSREDDDLGAVTTAVKDPIEGLLTFALARGQGSGRINRTRRMKLQLEVVSCRVQQLDRPGMKTRSFSLVGWQVGN